MLINALVKEKTKAKIIQYYLTDNSVFQNLKNMAIAVLRGKFRELKFAIVTQILNVFINYIFIILK